METCTEDSDVTYTAVHRSLVFDNSISIIDDLLAITMVA